MRSNISGIPYGRHAAVPMDPATRPEHFVVRQGKIRSTHEAFDEGKCLLYTEAGRYHFLIPTGKTDSDGDPVFDDYPAFPSRTDAQRWLDRAEAHEAALYLDGEPIMYGDRDSIAVIFNNLTGRNFADDPEKYRSYLEYMSRELHANWAQGRELGWRLGQQSGYQSKFELDFKRVPHIKVEYDPLYTGGNYQGVGKFAYIPLSLIEEFAKQDPDGDDGVELAFTKITKQDCLHIVHYTLDEIYNADGEMIEPPGDKSELKPYRVTLHEEPGDKFQIVFDCQAEDADHAAEQAEDAYPGCEVLNCVQFQEDTAGAVERPEPCVSSRKAAP